MKTGWLFGTETAIAETIATSWHWPPQFRRKQIIIRLL